MAADRVNQEQPCGATDRGTLVGEARYTARVLAGPAGNTSPIIRVLRDLADAHEQMEAALREIAVDVVLADGLTIEAQLAALWTVVRHHSHIAQVAIAE